MRVLVLGGTIFLSRTVAEEAVRRGHEVVCAARGVSGAIPEGARLVRVDRDAPDALDALRGERFDAVVDVAAMSYRWVADALSVLGADAGHWTFVSTVNVYADTATPGQRPGAPLLEPREAEGRKDDPNAVDPTLYGAIKVAAENAVRDTMGDRAFVVRPGLVVGPGDVTDRFGYWPARLSRGGRALVPDVPDQPIQYVDVRDLAAWIVDAAEQRLGGVFDAVGELRPLPRLLEEIAELAGGGAELVPVAPERLLELGVRPWGGPRSLPLWAPVTHYGVVSHDPEPARAAGLRARPLADTVAGALTYERALGLDRPRRAGLTMAEENEVCSGLDLPSSPPPNG
ncbi:MAG TPA: NAD-dependent epimerase/dehydratase family protein [Pseudonocardiaceae bacterium]